MLILSIHHPSGGDGIYYIKPFLELQKRKEQENGINVSYAFTYLPMNVKCAQFVGIIAGHLRNDMGDCVANCPY